MNFFEHSLIYPCSAFDGSILSAVNRSKFDEFRIDLNISHFVYVDHGKFNNILKHYEKIIDLYDEFNISIRTNPYYDFELLNFNDFSTGNYSEYLMGIHDIIEQMEELKVKNDESIGTKNEIDFDDDWNITLSFDYDHYLETILKNKLIVFSAKGTRKAQFSNEHGKDIIYISFILSDVELFFNHFLKPINEHPRVFVLKSMEGRSHFFEDLITNNLLNTNYLITQGYRPSEYDLITKFHQGWMVELDLLERKK